MRPTTVILFLTVLLVLPAAAQQQPSKPEEQAPQVFDSFSGPLSFNSAQGLVQGKVVMQQWQIANGQTEEIPHQGLLVVQLRAGTLVSEIEGKRERRRTDSFWSVPAGQRLIVHTEHDSVVLQVVDIAAQSTPNNKAGCAGDLPRKLTPRENPASGFLKA